MHIAIARFPPVPAEHDNDFRDWFAWSDEQLRGMAGLRGRRLLRAPDGSYTVLVEHDSAAAFAAMLKAEAVSMIRRGLGPLLNDRRQAMSYDVLMNFPIADGCRCDGDGTCSCEGAGAGPELRLASGGAAPAAASCAGDGTGRP